MTLFIQFYKTNDSYTIKEINLDLNPKEPIQSLENINKLQTMINSNSFIKDMTEFTDFVDEIVPLYNEFQSKHFKSINETISSIIKSIETATITIESKIKSK